MCTDKRSYVNKAFKLLNPITILLSIPLNKLPWYLIRERSQKPTIAMSSGGDNHCTGEMELFPNFINGNKR